MASSGRITGDYSKNSKVELILDWDLVSQSKSTNKSKITCVLYIKDKSGYRHYNFNSNKKTIKCNSTSISNSSTKFDVKNSTDKLMSASFSLTHKANGTCSFTLDASHASGVSIGTGSLTAKSFSLPQIKRVSKLNAISNMMINGSNIAYTTNYGLTDNLAITYKTFKKTIKNYKTKTKFSFTAAEQKTIRSLAGLDKTGGDVTFSYQIQTYSGSTHIGNSGTLKAAVTIPAIAPSVTAPAVPADEPHNSKIKIGGAYKKLDFYLKVNGAWKKVQPYVKISGAWKKIT